MMTVPRTRVAPYCAVGKVGMRIAYLDCFSGISGDMFLGALVDAGVPEQVLRETVQALNLGATLEIARVMRSGIAATKVDVVVAGEKDMPREQYWQQRAETGSQQPKRALKAAHSHEHDHGQAHSHDHPHEHHAGHAAVAIEEAGKPADSHTHAAHQHGRHLKEILQIIAGAPISDTARKRAAAIFRALGETEARIHNTDVEKIHFHEVGAVDALVDIVGAAVASEALGIDQWIFSPLNVGGGTVECAHGTIPIPAPATVELLRGAPVYSSGLNVELVTPTGAAIARTLAHRFGAFPQMKVERAGYGAGTRDFPGHPNVLRITIGEASAELAEAAPDNAQETVQVIEANLDDATPQVIGYVQEQLLGAGALDVFCTAIQMKKSRPGTLLTVLARPPDASRLAEIIFAESTTLGIRIRHETRQVLERRSLSVPTPWGEVRIKVGSEGPEDRNAAPEYEDCRRLAAANKVPLKRVMQEAMAAWLAQSSRGK